MFTSRGSCRRAGRNLSWSRGGKDCRGAGG